MSNSKVKLSDAGKIRIGDVYLCKPYSTSWEAFEAKVRKFSPSENYIEFWNEDMGKYVWMTIEGFKQLILEKLC